MVGRAMLSCDIDERWNGPPPRCEPIQCEALPEIFRGGKVLTPNGTFFNSRAELVCPRGFKTDGPRFITCTGTGQWSEPFTGCKGKFKDFFSFSNSFLTHTKLIQNNNNT